MSGTAFPGWYVEFQANVLRQLPRSDEMSKDVAGDWSRNQEDLKRVLRSALCPPEAPPVLRLISGGETLTIGPCDGKRTIAQATDVFGYIDPAFQRWQTNRAGKATSATPVAVHEVVRQATFKQIFRSLVPGPNKLRLEQDQVIDFVQKYRRWLCDEKDTIFLFRVSDKFFVVFVNKTPSLELHVRPEWLVEAVYNWEVGIHCRIVVPAFSKGYGGQAATVVP